MVLTLIARWVAGRGNWVCSRWCWGSRGTGRVAGIGKTERAARMPGHIGSTGDPSVNDLEVRNGSITQGNVATGAVVSVRAALAFVGERQTEAFTIRQLGPMADGVGGLNHAKVGIASCVAGSWLLWMLIAGGRRSGCP